jgi:hypothetical protein
MKEFVFLFLIRRVLAIPIHRKNYLIIKVYAVDTIDIRRHKETRNSYKYDLLASPSSRRIRNKNTHSVPSSIYHNL